MLGLPEGSPGRPFRENPPEQIKEVHWGGGEFVAGVQFPAASPSWNLSFLRGTTVSKTLSGANTAYDNRAGAFGTPGGVPTFVLAGLANVFIDLGRFDAWIETSTDGGATWVRSYEANDGFVVAVVYDKVNQFFYAQATNETPGSSVWQVLKSTDGRAWELIATTPGGPENHQYASPIMTDAADPIYKDGDGNNCAGGIYGYDEAKKLLMAPYPDLTAYVYENRYYGEQVQIRKENEGGHRTFRYVSIPDMTQVYSVAYSGGLWQVAGAGTTALIATSTDDGATWTTIYSGADESVAKNILGRG